MKRFPSINVGAVLAGISAFVILYVLLSLGLVFTLSLLPEQVNFEWVAHLFKLFGLLALLFPGYVAARIAEDHGLLHGFLVGLGAMAVSALFVTFTFSWEGSYREAAWLAILKIGILSTTLGSLGGLIGGWCNRKDQIDRLLAGG